MPEGGLPLSVDPPAPAAAPGEEGFPFPSSQTNFHPKPRVLGPCLTRQSFWNRHHWVCKEENIRSAGTLGASFVPGGEVIGKRTAEVKL